jgi:microcystin-dependent protein
MENYIGQIMLVPWHFAPVGWAVCDGQLLQVSQYQALYSLIGNTFGGSAPSTFAVPSLAPISPTGCIYIIALTGLYPVRP